MNYSDNAFDFIPCQVTRKCMQNGCWALDQTNMWEWLYAYEVDPTKGFMFANDIEINIIGNMMDRVDAPIPMSHSGASFGITMRNLAYIAKNGLEAYKRLYISNYEKENNVFEV